MCIRDRLLTHLYTAKNQKSLAPFVILLRRIFEARMQCLFIIKKRHPIFKTMTFTLVPIPLELFGPVTCGFFLVKEEAFVLHLSYSLHSEPLSSWSNSKFKNYFPFYHINLMVSVYRLGIKRKSKASSLTLWSYFSLISNSSLVKWNFLRVVDAFSYPRKLKSGFSEN